MTTGTAPVIEVRDLGVRFPGADHNAVADLSFAIDPGEILALVGESGSGKTVTAKVLLGLLPPEVTVVGSVRIRTGDRTTEVVGLPENGWRGIRGTTVGMVFQEPQSALNPVRTVGWQLDQVLRAHGWRSASARHTRILELLSLVGIPEPEQQRRRYPHEFSGGQKQRIVLAVALAVGPSLLIADEPSTALDVTVQQEILDLLDSLRRRLGTAVLLITHNMGVVADLADRVHVLRRSRTVETAEVTALFANPGEAYTQQLLAAVPALPPPPEAPRLAADGSRHGTAPAPGHSTDEPLVVLDRVVLGHPGRLGRRPAPVLLDLDLTVGAGEVLGVVGESGSGKTTVLHAITGALRPTTGSVTVFGQDLARLGPRARRALRARVGVVHQDPIGTLDPRFTVAEAIAEPLVLHRRGTGREVRARVADLLDAVALDGGLAGRLPHQLSGGQRQRVALARALALDPDLLLADEPTSALDVTVQAQVLDLFTDLRRRFGFACVFVSHDLAVVHRVSDRVAVLRGGRVVEQGPTARVLGAPGQDYTRRLVAAVPVPDPVRQRARRASAQRQTVPSDGIAPLAR